MEKGNFSQLELFAQAKRHSQGKMDTPNTFWNYIRNYERVILVIIGFIITGVVSFSLGVEKGKRLAVLKSEAYLDMAKSTHSINKQALKNTAQKQDISKSAPKGTNRQYTVQVATFQTRTYAQKEAEVLRKKGFLPLVLPKGKYSILCVGNFSSQKTAKSLLSKLKQRYRDCFIRRL